MRIIVDADANPTNKLVIDIAQKYNIDVIFVFDSSHHFDFDYGEMIICDKGSDSVDFKILSILQSDDILITQDYELAGFSIAKNAKVLNPSGLIYKQENIDNLLQQRYLNKKARDQGYRSKIKKRSKDDDENFINSLQFLINSKGD